VPLWVWIATGWWQAPITPPAPATRRASSGSSVLEVLGIYVNPNLPWLALFVGLNDSGVRPLRIYWRGRVISTAVKRAMVATWARKWSWSNLSSRAVDDQ